MNYLERIGVDENPDFEVGFKFEPMLDMYTQLVSVIPQRHSNILPKNLRSISSSADSQVIDMYPTTFPLDMICKTVLYKCLPHVPYLDVERIEKAISAAVSASQYTELELCRSTTLDDIYYDRKIVNNKEKKRLWQKMNKKIKNEQKRSENANSNSTNDSTK